MDKIKIASFSAATLMVMLAISGMVLYRGMPAGNTDLSLPQAVSMKNQVTYHSLAPPYGQNVLWEKHNVSASYAVDSGFMFLSIQLDTALTSPLTNSSYMNGDSFVQITTHNHSGLYSKKVSILLVLDQTRSGSASNGNNASAALSYGGGSVNVYKKSGVDSNGNSWVAGLAVEKINIYSITTGDLTPLIGLVGGIYSGEELPLATVLVIPEITVAALVAAVIAAVIVAIAVYVILFLLAHQGPNNQITLYVNLGLSHINIPWWEFWLGSGYGEYGELGAYDDAGYYAGYYHSSALYYPAITTGGLNTYLAHTSPWNPNDGPPWG